jgi:lysozyme
MIDVSIYQGVIDWKKVRATGHHVAAIKAAEGNYITDGAFHYNSVAAKAHGIIPMAYFYGHPSENPRTQARHFVTVAKDILTKGNGIPWLDVEVRERESDRQLQEWCLAWFSIIDPIVKTKSILYTDSGFIGSFGTALVDHPLAIANYDNNPGDLIGVNIGGWNRKNVYIHQYTDKGSCPGIRGNVDLDHRFVNLTKMKIGGRKWNLK